MAKIKGISEELAIKYFKRVCVCGKKLNPDEVAMFLKLSGRYENIEDNRNYLCKKCLCEMFDMETKEYDKKKLEFRNQGCELF